MEKIYDHFLDAMEKVAGAVGIGTLMIVALSVLGGIFVFQIIMTIVACARRKKNRGGCQCGVKQINGARRKVVLFVAWVFAIFAVLNLVPFTAMTGTFAIADIILPIVFLVAVYLLELIFSLLTAVRCNCGCHCGKKCNCETKETEIVEVNPKSEKTKKVVNKTETKQIIETKTEIVADPKQAKIDELATKIERQSKTPNDERSAEKMAELQRRMDNLRKNYSTTTRTETRTTTSANDNRTRKELEMEHDRLKYQYETLKNRSKNMSTVPSRNKFDESEVENALAGLRNAMETLQRKIDEKSE